MKSLRLLLVAAALFAATTALAGEGLIGIQVTNGTADLVGPKGGSSTIAAYDHSEIGVGIQYWRLMSKDYAFNFSIGTGFFSETNTSSTPGESDFKYTQSSWSGRIGGDRAAHVGERAILYFGPGIEYWSGKAKWDGGPAYTTSVESATVTRIGLSGRIGGVMMMSDNIGFNCQVGRYVAYATASEKKSKATWFPSGFQASGGILFRI